MFLGLRVGETALFNVALPLTLSGVQYFCLYLTFTLPRSDESGSSDVWETHHCVLMVTKRYVALSNYLSAVVLLQIKCSSKGQAAFLFVLGDMNFTVQSQWMELLEPL